MADSVNRIVPPSVSLDRAAQIGRDGKGKDRSEARKKRQNELPGAANPAENDKGSENVAAADEEQTKGKNLDVTA